MGRREGWSIVAVPVAQFSILSIAALLIVGVAVSIASRRVGEREAIVVARSEALVKGQALVEPAVRDGLLDGDAASIAAVDRVVRDQVLDATLVRVKVWRADGRILYSDEPTLIGQVFPLGDEEVDALQSGTVAAEISNLERPENALERPQGQLLEVYLPVRTPNGTAVLFETYYRYDTVVASGDQIWRSFAPITVGALVVLALIEIPLAWSLARRLRQRSLEREELLRRAIDVSERERRRIAHDLHDGVVQDLAGVSYALAAAGRRDAPLAPAELDAAAGTVRASVEALRTLLVEIYPPNLAEEGLGPALADLIGRSRSTGLTTELDTTALDDDVPTESAALVYRVVQEALRNVERHAHATTVRVQVSSTRTAVIAEIVDDGVGFDADAARPTDAGHLGLNALLELSSDVGAELAIDSNGSGTTVRVVAPNAKGQRSR